MMRTESTGLLQASNMVTVDSCFNERLSGNVELHADCSDVYIVL